MSRLVRNGTLTHNPPEDDDMAEITQDRFTKLMRAALLDILDEPPVKKKIGAAVWQFLLKRVKVRPTDGDTITAASALATTQARARIIAAGVADIQDEVDDDDNPATYGK